LNEQQVRFQINVQSYLERDTSEIEYKKLNAVSKDSNVYK